MGWGRSGNALDGTARLAARGDLPFTLPRKQRRLSALVFSEGAASNFYAKSLALQFEIRESVLGNEVDQFPELVHIDRSIEMSGGIAMPAPPAFALPALRWLVGCGRYHFRLLGFLM